MRGNLAQEKSLSNAPHETRLKSLFLSMLITVIQGRITWGNHKRQFPVPPHTYWSFKPRRNSGCFWILWLKKKSLFSQFSNWNITFYSIIMIGNKLYSISNAYDLSPMEITDISVSWFCEYLEMSLMHLITSKSW